MKCLPLLVSKDPFEAAQLLLGHEHVHVYLQKPRRSHAVLVRVVLYHLAASFQQRVDAIHVLRPLHTHHLAAFLINSVSNKAFLTSKSLESEHLTIVSSQKLDVFCVK